MTWMITRPKSKDDERPVLPSNDEFRKAKGRSPNHFDAVKFACAWIEDGDKLGDPKKTYNDTVSLPTPSNDATPLVQAQDSATQDKPLRKRAPSQAVENDAMPSIHERLENVYRQAWGDQ